VKEAGEESDIEKSYGDYPPRLWGREESGIGIKERRERSRELFPGYLPTLTGNPASLFCYQIRPACDLLALFGSRIRLTGISSSFLGHRIRLA
jgi:hypothetical protein